MTCLIAPWTSEYWCACMTEKYLEIYGRGKLWFLVGDDVNNKEHWVKIDDEWLFSDEE